MSNGSTPPNPPLKKKLETISVREFFSQINWYGPDAYDTENLLLANSQYETVGQFFSTFPWQGKNDSQPPTDDWQTNSDNEVFSIEDDTLTLEDLSALF